MKCKAFKMKLVEKYPAMKKILRVSPRVAVIRFSGVIADQANKRNGVSYHKFSKAIDKAFDLKDVKAVVMVINSPGGAPAQCSLISAHMRQRAEAIEAKRKEEQKNQGTELTESEKLPLYAFVEDVAASGGYWLSCIADEIYVQESSIVGSIGVVSASFGFEDLIKKYGIKRRVHTAGKSKSFMDPFLAEEEADIKHLKSIQVDIHKNFKDWVKTRRGKRLKGTDAALFEGQFWTGQTAVDKGLVDGVSDAHSFLVKKFGEDITMVECSPSDRKLLSFLPFLGSKIEMETDNLVLQVIDSIESKGEWNRYGL